MKKNKEIWIIGGIASIVIFIIIFLQLKYTKFVYYWDYVGYYENCLSVISHFNTSFFLGIQKVIYTIFYSDYNYLAAILPSIPMAILGKGRTVYTLGITVFYYIPFIFLFLTLAKSILKDTKYRTVWLIVSLLPCMPILIYLNYMGYVDIGGLNIIILIYLVMKSEKHLYINYAIMGFLLMILFFFRRWYMFYIIAFLITLFVFDFIDFVKSKEKKKMFFKYLKKYLIIGGVMLGIVLITLLMNFVFFRNDDVFKLDWSNFYIVKLLFVNYGDMYSAYSRPLSSDLAAIGVKFGYIIIMLTIVSIIIAIKNKKDIKKVLFLTIQMILCFALFEHTQSHDVHHFLLYVVNIMALIVYILKNSSMLWVNVSVSVILIMNIIFSIPFCYNNPIVKFLKNNYIINSMDLNILRRNDLEQFEDIYQEINRLSENGVKKIYINASSSIINDSMVYSYKMFNVRNSLLQVAHVDSRDGIPKSIKQADIIMVTVPDQKHMIPENQKIISYINDIFINEEKRNSFTENFEPIKQMKIDDVDIYFFTKIDDITEEEYSDFEQKATLYMESYKK